MVHLPTTLCGKALNICADAALCVLVYLWLTHEGFERAGRIAAFVCAIHPLHLQWSISGMETELVAAMGVWCWYAFALKGDPALRRSRRAIPVKVGQPSDGRHYLRSNPVARPPSAMARYLLFALIVSPWLLIAGRYYGNPIPVTGQAKMIVYGWFADHDPDDTLRFATTGDGHGLSSIVQLEPTWLLRRLPRQQKLLNAFTGSPAAFFLTVAAAAGCVLALRSRRSALKPAIAWAMIYLAAFLLSRVLLFNWYLVPPLPIYEMLAGIGLAAGMKRVHGTMPPWLRSTLIPITVATAAIGCGVATGLTLRRSQLIEENAQNPAGRWLDANSSSTDRILLEPIGYIGYYSHRRIIDMIGLVSRRSCSSIRVRRIRHGWSSCGPTSRNGVCCGRSKRVRSTVRLRQKVMTGDPHIRWPTWRNMWPGSAKNRTNSRIYRRIRMTDDHANPGSIGAAPGRIIQEHLSRNKTRRSVECNTRLQG